MNPSKELLAETVLSKKFNDSQQKELLLFIDIQQKLSEELISILKAYFEENETPKMPKIQKLVWLGKQTELVDLLVALQQKGWVNKINRNTDDLSAITRSILSLFDLSLTKRGKNTNEFDSLYQAVKGKYDKIEHHTYVNSIDTEKISPVFSSIGMNVKKL
ncbi:hypothetical protein D3C72_1750610 [compost metagenome]